MTLIVIVQIVEYKIECPFDSTDNLSDALLQDFAEKIVSVYRTFCYAPITYRYDFV